ncbi:hypothetical protein HKD37_09G026210 [Glycine soja]
MALYMDEEEIWKCPKHPSKRRRSGICPTCLRDRLVTLCPDCANVRPCSCYATSSSSSSSSSSSLSRFSGAGDGVGSVGRVHNLIEQEPGLRRSRSMAIPFLRSRSRFSGGGDRVSDLDSTRDSPAMNGSRSARSFWSMFKSQKSSRHGGGGGGAPEQEWEAKKILAEERDGDGGINPMMVRSRSVAVTAVTVVSGDGELRPRTKGRGWFFPSPMKAFRQSKVSKVIQEGSPFTVLIMFFEILMRYSSAENVEFAICNTNTMTEILLLLCCGLPCMLIQAQGRMPHQTVFVIVVEELSFEQQRRQGIMGDYFMLVHYHKWNRINTRLWSKVETGDSAKALIDMEHTKVLIASINNEG